MVIVNKVEEQKCPSNQTGVKMGNFHRSVSFREIKNFVIVFLPLELFNILGPHLKKWCLLKMGSTKKRRVSFP